MTGVLLLALNFLVDVVDKLLAGEGETLLVLRILAVDTLEANVDCFLGLMGTSDDDLVDGSTPKRLDRLPNEDIYALLFFTF